MSTDKKQVNNANEVSTGTTAGSSRKVPDCVVETCYEYRGVVVPKDMSKQCLDQLYRMECRPDDVFIVTFPKAGTTWMEQLTILIQLEGDKSKLDGTHLTRLVPFLDVYADLNRTETLVSVANNMPSPRIMKTHCLTDWLPEAIRTDDPQVKVIYVVRNPKDTAVSYYNFCLYVRDMPRYESWDEFFEELIIDRLPYGSWFENVLPWWHRRNHPNVLFVKYEDMKRDLPGTVREVARFMGKTLSDDVIETIANASTFSAMKKSVSSNPDFMNYGREDAKSRSFMRKGEVGDWKNFFSEDQNKRFDDLYRMKMANSGLELDFDPSS